MIFGSSSLNLDTDKGLDYSIENGLGHFEIDLMSETVLVASLDSGRIEDLRQRAFKGNVRLSLHAPFNINLAEGAPFIRDGCLQYFKQCLHLAHLVEATHLTVHCGFCLGLPSWHHVRTRALDDMSDNISELLNLCEKLDVMLAIENLNRIEQGEFFYLGDNLNDLELIFQRAHSPHIGLCLDIGHAHTSEGPQAYLDTFGSRIISIHYHDNDGNMDGHLDIGKGSVDWPMVARSLKAMAYSGPFISETLHDPPIESMRKFLTFNDTS
jgi:sugar phosphate isomerase/epimerase